MSDDEIIRILYRDGYHCAARRMEKLAQEKEDLMLRIRLIENEKGTEVYFRFDDLDGKEKT